MKTGLLYKEIIGSRKNIGDYIQTIAAEQFLENIDYYINMESVSDFKSDGERVKMIMNGWFMGNPNHWPPSSDIFPLFISFHIAPHCDNRMLNKEGIEYLKKYSPVGCRDLATMKQLKSMGVPAYFSGCLTLSLCLHYKSAIKSGEVFFVDPYYEFHKNIHNKRTILPIIKSLINIPCNYKTINVIYSKIKFRPVYQGNCSFLQNTERLLRAACFYRCYRHKFSKQLLKNATYVTHILSPSNKEMFTERMELAKALVSKYAKASLVVTSRIHVALPCLGLETPVIFTTPDSVSENRCFHSQGRFDGLLTLFRVLRFTGNDFTTDDAFLNSVGMITYMTKIYNKDDYRQYQTLLIQKCKEFASISKSF